MTNITTAFNTHVRMQCYHLLQELVVQVILLELLTDSHLAGHVNVLRTPLIPLHFLRANITIGIIIIIINMFILIIIIIIITT